MRALLSRLLLATALLATPALAQSDADAPAEAEPADAAVETGDGTGTTEAEDDGGEEAKAEVEAETKIETEESWNDKMRRRHHEGDVALGVCGARMSVLMWFYQSSVADGRDDLQSAYDAIRESRTVLKEEAERRAIEDGVGTSVSVMNEQSEKMWLELVKASEEAETFQAAHDTLFADVQECLSIFFNRGATPEAEVETAPVAAVEEAADEEEESETAAD